MKKKILTLMLIVMAAITLSSCADIYAQTTMDNEPNVNVIIQYGTPYYVNGYRYYLYNGWYYRPYFYNNRYYTYRYRRPLPPPQHNRHYMHVTPQRQHHTIPNQGMRHRPNGHHQHGGNGHFSGRR